MKKYVSDLLVNEVERLHEDYVLLRLTDPRAPLPAMAPGQFVEIRVDQSPSTFLRRPISIHNVDRVHNELWLLIHLVGDGTRKLATLRKGDRLNCLYPLGHGFTIPETPGQRALLVGGGIGSAPLLYYGQQLLAAGCTPHFLLGGRSGKDLLQLERFSEMGEVYVTTDDGTVGQQGFVTQHTLWADAAYDHIAVCGPKPMMKAVAHMAHERGIRCEVSLENLMACGLGACLCCVEKDADGHHVCVCQEGPVFNIDRLGWN